MLAQHTNLNAAYNSSERESEHASTCQEDTRKSVLEMVMAWVESNDDHPICWLQGPAGSGKSTIAHTIAQQCDEENMLAFSFFFSRRNLDRSDITKFFPTFAYQLAGFLPSIKQSMQDALAKDPAIPRRNLKDQFRKLIVRPVLSTTERISTMIVVIDGLDEYGGNVPLKELIRLLVDALPKLPFRLLFTSRPEAHIRDIFSTPSIDSKIYRLALQDFSAHHDVYLYLRSRLSEIQRKRKLPESWPSDADLRNLAWRSEGLFIYVSTLVKFVDDEYGIPQRKLQDAMSAHRGLDSLFDQVLRSAQNYPHFKRVIGAFMFLRDHLDISALVQLLQLEAVDIRLALRGCLSILMVPDHDKGYIRGYHASLQDFLIDPDRVKDHFLDPVEHNMFIVDDCMKLIVADLENNLKDGVALRYACQNWCHHFHLVLSNRKGIDYIKSHFKYKVEGFLENSSQWLQNWMCNIQFHSKVEQACADLHFAFTCIRVSQLYLKWCQE